MHNNIITRDHSPTRIHVQTMKYSGISGNGRLLVGVAAHAASSQTMLKI